MSDLSNLPLDYPTVPFQVGDEIAQIKLARELALNIHPVEEILKRHGVDEEKWRRLRSNKRFGEILSSEVKAWETAVNTGQRVKAKAGAMLEEWMPELYARLNDKSEPLMAKVKAAELAARLAGFGEVSAKVVDPSDRVSITINLGADNQLQYSKPRLPTQVIDHEPAPAAAPEEDEGVLAGEFENVSTD